MLRIGRRVSFYACLFSEHSLPAPTRRPPGKKHDWVVTSFWDLPDYLAASSTLRGSPPTRRSLPRDPDAPMSRGESTRGRARPYLLGPPNVPPYRRADFQPTPYGAFAIAPPRRGNPLAYEARGIDTSVLIDSATGAAHPAKCCPEAKPFHRKLTVAVNFDPQASRVPLRRQ